MRIRSALICLLVSVMGAFGSQAPAQAAPTDGVVIMELTYDCFGCGSSQHRTWWWCYGVCIINGNPCVGSCHYYGSGWNNESAATCPLSGTAAGHVNEIGDYNLTWVGGMFVATWSGETTGVAAGVVTVMEPVGLPCGGPARLWFSGVQAGI